MKTAKLYKMLDPVCPTFVLYNLRKRRGFPEFLLKVWNRVRFDKEGVQCPWVQTELYPDVDNETTVINDFLAVCAQVKDG